ncbi:hypothetical protein M409DRAFT_67195 [Zasmidium cellare ATCC 36951]|uniref:ubiquitinyl hydrolase 1 n=1 Tax=Zasmidium cellare ATCC 36951 TaxID=1080233 RepID=A0A6A6CIT7_ZASCE|nr:uncharacterized protein M409DRAFT_67195 [Zasmidium cellare ATCC 36951]KAF2165326.1 hypothetical protein M409DRAFT_67195 [Zasmidium cellare ATCC 36951]
MSGSENGANTNTAGDRAMVSPDRTIGLRSASPAKRSAADMEDVSAGQKHVPGSFASGGQEEQSQKVPGSFTNENEQGPSDFDVAMAGMTPASQSMETQETGNSFATSDGGAMSVDTQATSVQQDGESNGESTSAESKSVHQEPYTTAQTEEQVRHVEALAAKALDEGDRGVVVSTKWLARVKSRTSEGLKSGEYPKDAREGNVGPLDNSDIVPEGAFRPPFLRDHAGSDFIPLKPGLSIGSEIEVLPYDTHGYIIGAYGYKETKPIVRYAHNTAPDGATQTNIIYELYPPTITVRKVPQSSQDEAPKKKTGALAALHARKEVTNRGQQTVDDAVKLVSSRTERFQTFLRRAKEAAGIPQTTKVKIWRLPNPTDIAVDKAENQQPGVLSPPASRDPSPAKAGHGSPPRLVIDQATFNKMEVGRDLEATDAKDLTNDEKYTGSSTMELFGFFEDQTILLEEQIGGPAGGEFQSDQKKGAKSFLNKKGGGSKPGSAPASGRTSPAPGGIMTRGRMRKDGRTRGVVGLSNLGNTCYMNSALQCIRSVEELALYFLSNKYKPEINNDNPLGHHGAMANAYAGVLKGIYEQNSGSSFSPTQFKKTLGSLQPLFSGYGQQDSQEFLSFLVDALHEDLNRIYKKPYIENPDSEDDKVRDPEYVHQLGQIYRENHAKRNASVAMDLFSGFYKNTMECPDCDKVSVTFDPYSLLTVQLPMDHAFQHIITFVPLHGKPVMHQIDVDKNSSIKTLKEHIAKKHAGVDANRLWMVEVYSNKIYKIFDDSTSLAEASVQTNDYLFIYELDAVPKNTYNPKKTFSYGYTFNSNKGEDVPAEGMDSPKADVFTVPIFQRFVNRDKHEVGMHPLYITLTREEAKNYDVIVKKVLSTVQNITSRPILREFEEKEGPTGTIEEVDDEGGKEPNGTEDAAGVSDHSTQSEDGYVNVSLDKPADGATVNGTSPMQIDEAEGLVPPGFMDSQYYLSPALRNQLFDLKYSEGPSDSGLHVTNLTGVKDSVIKTMHDRVKPARRASIQSSNSDESTTSTNNSEENESDADDPDKPDLVLGEESTLSTPTVNDSDEDESGVMPPSEQEPTQSRAGRRKNNKKNKRGKNGKKRRPMTHSKKDRAGQNRENGSSSLKSPSPQQDDSPYYVQLGECIVLDWRPEAADALLGGDASDPNEMRGHCFVNENGRNGELFYDAELEARRKKRDERKKHGLDLEDCFVETGKREVLSEDNAWYCNRCKELRRATKTLEIWTLPDILVVHLKRFGGNRSFRDKIDVLVDYPIEGLDLNDKVGLKEDDKDYTYDLFAVDNHYGGLGGGHYTAMAKNFYDGEWYDYNDSITSKIGSGSKSLHSAAAYLLFYRRRSDKPLGPQYLQDIVNEFRNPPAESVVEDAAADDESGEDRLGGPAPSSQHGSSSALVGAGVGATSNQTGSAGSGGVGAAGRLLTQGRTTSSEERTYGNAGNDGWGFDALDQTDDAGAQGASLLHAIDDDADSNTAQYDRDNDSGFDDNMDYDTNHNSADANTPFEYDDDSNVFHVEHATDLPDLVAPEDPPPADIHLSDVNMEGLNDAAGALPASHGKRD